MVQISIKDTLSTDINDLPGEIWEDIPGYNERYQVSQYSRVKSVIFKKPVIIKKTLSNGRYKVILYPKKGVIKNEECSRLCAAVFDRAPEENEVIRYKNGNVLFDAIQNIEWTSRKHSAQTAYANRRFPKGHSSGILNGMAKLNPSQVIEIRQKRSKGSTRPQLAQEYNVSVRCIETVTSGKNWKNVN